MENKGKHAVSKKGSKGKIIFLLIILLIILVGVIVIHKYDIEISPSKITDLIFNKDVKSTENGPVISYYDEQTKLKVQLRDEQVFNQNIVLLFDKGNAKISKDNGKYETYNGEMLTDGNYTIKVEATDKTSTKVSFIIDTKIPAVSGVDDDYYTRTVTIKLEDINDTKIATLTQEGEQSNPIDLKSQKDLKYKVSENGKYTLYLEDYHGNSYTHTFVVDKNND